MKKLPWILLIGGTAIAGVLLLGRQYPEHPVLGIGNKVFGTDDSEQAIATLPHHAETLQNAEQTLRVAEQTLQTESSYEPIVAWQPSSTNPDNFPLPPQVRDYQPVALTTNEKPQPRIGEQMRLPMLNGETVTATVETITTATNGDYSWGGHLDGHGNSYPVVMTYGKSSVFATITTPAGSYSLEIMNGKGWLYKNPAESELSTPGGNDFLEPETAQP